MSLLPPGSLIRNKVEIPFLLVIKKIILKQTFHLSLVGTTGYGKGLASDVKGFFEWKWPKKMSLLPPGSLIRNKVEV